MSESKCTPGPWEVSGVQTERGKFDIIESNIEGGAILAQSAHFPNARLMAMSPDLLAMLKAANHALYVVGTGRAMKDALRESRDLIRAVEGRDIETGKPL